VLPQLKEQIPASWFFSEECLAKIVAEVAERRGVDLPNFPSSAVFRSIFNSGATPLVASCMKYFIPTPITAGEDAISTYISVY